MTSADIPPLGRDNHAEWLTAMRRHYDQILVKDLHVGATLILSDLTEVEVIAIEPHRDYTGRLHADWVSVTHLTPAGQQERIGRWLKGRVFVPRRPRY